ncbi:hypothetical protein BT93_L0205 [Corymbia citriodora subsp. variegata]|uniref:NB-ARC domain-containing protein n=1 Tax=Corymbia citriodora subsp. variegata TaxID=360336 RepID=A0A8T0CQD7_CORYI|nr:hypothetical protein BT93_L0205 [Corymbia citriodora subsp. variegata]
MVLDDVWNEKYEEWTSLLKPFEAGAKGSKIIITTRNHPVYSMIGAMPYFLNELSIDNCTCLLAYHALGVKNFEGHPDLETIGKKIAEKCRGLPLATKILGSLLCNKENVNEWEAILNDRIWDVATRENGEVLPILKLSYVHLPSYLKRCFAYCAIFPKDYEFERDELALLWIGEGFLDGRKAKENILTSGRNYFDELVSRSFFQQSSVDTSKFFMHDLLNDLAKSIADATCFTSGESHLVGDEDDTSFKEKVRYASFVSRWYITSNNLRAYAGMKVLRSFMLLSNIEHINISKKVLLDLLTNLKYLRVLSLCHCDIFEVPDCVANLKHLRYLNLSYTYIFRLPASIGTLCKLQALILRGCVFLSMLPPDITNLVSLQFLDIRDTKRLKEMPLNIGNLKNLIIFSKFVVGQEQGSRLKELKNLPHLQGELLVSELQKVKEDDELEARVLRSLRPHINLENLSISHYGGELFPSWLGDPSYFKMVSLCLLGCPKVTSLSSLGQLPSLRELSLEGLNAVSMIGSEFYGTKRFPSLRTLKFQKMLAWKEWSHNVGGREEDVPFSCLQHLVVKDCPVLMGTLPCQLDHLIKLEIHSCLHLNNSTGVVRLPSLYGDGMRNLTCLRKLAIDFCPQFTSFVAGEGEIELLSNLERMELRCCPSLERLPSKMHVLRHLGIWNCPKIMGLTIPSDDPNTKVMMSQLEHLQINDYDFRISFSFAKNGLVALKTLIVENCKGVELLEEITVVESLKSLNIYRCMNLGSLPHCLHMLAHLTHLEIRDCPALEIEDFPPLPLTLSSLTLTSCPKIKSIANCNIAGCNNLTKLVICKCSALEMEDFPLLPVTLSKLELDSCPKIKSLPKEWHHLTCLQKLHIFRCENIECFPKGDLPPNLRRFNILGCENMKQPVREWGLPMLTSLEHVEIDGMSMGGERDKVRFPSGDEDEEEENAWSLLFPSSLISLRISGMRNVERLSNGLRNHLSSLISLSIKDWPKLRDLPEDGLPPSLKKFSIYKCENLKNRCSKPTGDYWHLIQEIPNIFIECFQIH